MKKKYYRVTFQQVETCDIIVRAADEDEARIEAENAYQDEAPFGSWNYEEPEIVGVHEEEDVDEDEDDDEEDV